MSVIVDVMDTLLSVGSKNCELSSQTKNNAWTATSCMVFFVLVVGAQQKYAQGGRHFSTILTIGTMLQCLAFVLLNIKVKYQQSVRGLSARMLEMYVLHFIFKLVTTTQKDGYLPADKSGDYAYQVFDMLSMLLVLNLLYAVYKRYPDTYQSEHDTLPIHGFVPVCVLLGILLRGDLNNSLFYDSTWMISTLLDTISLLPQLFMLTKLGGQVECLTSHFVASIVAGRCCAFAFWLYGYKEIGRIPGRQIGSYAVLASYSLHLLLCADFMYYYGKGLYTKDRKSVV